MTLKNMVVNVQNIIYKDIHFNLHVIQVFQENLIDTEYIHQMKNQQDIVTI